MKLESHFLTQNLSLRDIFYISSGRVLTRYVPAQNTNKPKNMWWLSILLVCLFGKGLRWATGLITPTPVSLVAIPVEFWTETPRKIVIVCVGGFSIRPSRLQSRITCSIFQAEYLEEGNASSASSVMVEPIQNCVPKNAKIPTEKCICIQVSFFPHIFAGGHLVFLFIIREDNEEDLRLMKQKLLLF